MVRNAAAAWRASLRNSPLDGRAGGSLLRRRAVPDAAAGAFRLRPADQGNDRGQRRSGNRLAYSAVMLLGRTRHQPTSGQPGQRRDGRGAAHLPGPDPVVRDPALGISRGRRRRTGTSLRPGRRRRHGHGQHQQPIADGAALRADLESDRRARFAGSAASDLAAGHRRTGYRRSTGWWRRSVS